MSKILFRIEDMKNDEIHSFDLDSESDGYANGIYYSKNIVSHIEVKRVDGEEHNANKHWLFINLYMGNLNICTIVTQKDYILELKDRPFHSFGVREAENFDYKEVLT